MERFLRLIISLSLGGLVTLIGFAITGYSVLQIYGAYRDYSDFAEKRAVLELASALSGSTGYLEIAEKVFFLIGFLPLILIIPGVFLFGFGIRLMIRRIRMGLPEAAQRPKSEAELWGSTAIYGFGVLITAPALFFGLLDAPETFSWALHSKETHGKAVKVWHSETTENNEHELSRVRIEYTTLEGKTEFGEFEAREAFAQNLTRHPDIKIAYVPGRPKQVYPANRVPSIYSVLWAFIWRVGMLYLAICGLLANFMPEKSQRDRRFDTAGISPSASDTQPRPTNQFPRQKRSGFGRRGMS